MSVSKEDLTRCLESLTKVSDSVEAWVQLITSNSDYFLGMPGVINIMDQTFVSAVKNVRLSRKMFELEIEHYDAIKNLSSNQKAEFFQSLYIKEVKDEADT